MQQTFGFNLKKNVWGNIIFESSLSRSLRNGNTNPGNSEKTSCNEREVIEIAD